MGLKLASTWKALKLPTNPKSTARLRKLSYLPPLCHFHLWTQSKQQYIPSSHYAEKNSRHVCGQKFFFISHFSLVIWVGKRKLFLILGNYICYVFPPSSHIQHINISFFLIYTLIFHIQTNILLSLSCFLSRKWKLLSSSLYGSQFISGGNPNSFLGYWNHWTVIKHQLSTSTNDRFHPWRRIMKTKTKKFLIKNTTRVDSKNGP